MKHLRLQLEGYRLTTAEILYHLPDHPHLLQSFVWQELDIAPRFPVLRGFLDFWSRNIEGRLHSVKVAQAPLLVPSRLRHAQISYSLH
ncbi:MAG: Usg family protein [Alphaproteobacteria bacterium]|nr:Usg family protein [Alphaproteobacteria bacterium]